MPYKTIKEKLLKPVKLSSVQKQITNALVSRSKTLSFLVGSLNQTITTEFILNANKPLKDYTIFLYLSLWDKPCILAMDSWPLEKNINSFLSGEDLGNLPDELALSTIETSHEPLINHLETALNSDIKFYKYSNKFNHSTNEGLSLKITVGDKHTCNAKLLLNEHIINDLIKAIDNTLPIEKVQTINKITIPIYLEYGRTNINKPLISSIELDDILLIDSKNSLDKSNIHIRLTNTHLYSAKKIPDSKNYLFQEEIHMKDNEGEKDINLDNLPLTINFDLGKVSLPISELEKLGQGYTLDLDNKVPLNELITLRIENQILGKGELVEIADRIGVRITQLNLPENKGNTHD